MSINLLASASPTSFCPSATLVTLPLDYSFLMVYNLTAPAATFFFPSIFPKGEVLWCPTTSPQCSLLPPLSCRPVIGYLFPPTPLIGLSLPEQSTMQSPSAYTTSISSTSLHSTLRAPLFGAVSPHGAVSPRRPEFCRTDPPALQDSPQPTCLIFDLASYRPDFPDAPSTRTSKLPSSPTVGQAS